MTDIVLQTNDDQKQLALRDIIRSGGNYSCTLSVTSHGFSCMRPFHFSDSYLQRFYDAFRIMDRTLVGECNLQHEYEDDVIHIQGDGLGHLKVFGTIVQHGELEQQLEFAFVTDQTSFAG